MPAFNGLPRVSPEFAKKGEASRHLPFSDHAGLTPGGGMPFRPTRTHLQILAALSGLSYPAGGESRTLLGVQRALSDFQTYGGGTRPRLLVLIADGQPTSGYSPCGLASALLEAGIKTIVVGVSPSFTPGQYSCLVDNPSTDM